MDPLILTVDPWLEPGELAAHLPDMRVERRLPAGRPIRRAWRS